MKYLAPFDPHVHLRGTEYREDFYALAQRDAAAVGLSGMAEMPNCQPVLDTVEVLTDRRLRGDKAKVPVHCHAGITADPCRAVDMLLQLKSSLWRRSDKIFYTHSTGNLGILDKDYQDWLWRFKAKIDYRGVSLGHFEDADKFVGVFDPGRPESHSEHQPPEAETACVERQIRSAVDAGFRGTMYICHVSSPDTVRLVRKHLTNPQHVNFSIVMEATFHHIFLNVEDDYPIHGNLLRCNPPIRLKKIQEELLNMLLAGNIQVIGTDHAPHPLSCKCNTSFPACGLPVLPFWPKGIEKLRALGVLRVNMDWIISTLAHQMFTRYVPPASEVDCTYDPSLWDAYGFNPFSRVDH